MTNELQTELLDIDDALEKKAASNNLSVVNVKSILHVRGCVGECVNYAPINVKPLHSQYGKDGD